VETTTNLGVCDRCQPTAQAHRTVSPHLAPTCQAPACMIAHVWGKCGAGVPAVQSQRDTVSTRRWLGIHHIVLPWQSYYAIGHCTAVWDVPFALKELSAQFTIRVGQDPNEAWRLCMQPGASQPSMTLKTAAHCWQHVGGRAGHLLAGVLGRARRRSEAAHPLDRPEQEGQVLLGRLDDQRKVGVAHAPQDAPRHVCRGGR
jgi:hypothetical protein